MVVDLGGDQGAMQLAFEGLGALVLDPVEPIFLKNLLFATLHALFKPECVELAHVRAKLYFLQHYQ